MNDLYSPEISVVIVIPDNLATIRNTIESLRTQTAKDRMEVDPDGFSAEFLHHSSVGAPAAALGLLCTLRYLLPAIFGLPFLGKYLPTIRTVIKKPGTFSQVDTE